MTYERMMGIYDGQELLRLNDSLYTANDLIHSFSMHSIRKGLQRFPRILKAPPAAFSKIINHKMAKVVVQFHSGSLIL